VLKAYLLKSVARREPLVIVIDDLHDADLAMFQMVCFLARALRDSPVMLLVTYREAEVERSPELRAVFAELARESNQLLLRGLSRSMPQAWFATAPASCPMIDSSQRCIRRPAAIRCSWAAWCRRP